MGRAVRESRLESRNARGKIGASNDPHWRSIGAGEFIGYRKPIEGAGTWVIRFRIDGSAYKKKTIGEADDIQDADNAKIFDFYQAQKRARDIFEEIRKTKTAGSIKPSIVTVSFAIQHYLEWYKVHRKALKETENTIDAHIRPRFGERIASELTKSEIELWHRKLATTPPRRRKAKNAKHQTHGEKPITDEAQRARKSTANRILTVFKAILNKAFQNGLISDDKEWRKVKPFENADQAITRFLTNAESVRLINASDADFRLLVTAALFSGARYGDLTRLKVAQFNSETSQVYISAEGKSSKGRYVPLSVEGFNFFLAATTNKRGTDFIFTRADGKPWGKNHQVRPLACACERAKIEPAISFHELRHTYASLLAQAGADLLTISKLLGHADTRITSRHYAHLCDKTLADTVNRLLPSFGHTTS